MSSELLAVSVRGLSKSYTIAHNAQRHTTAAEALAYRVRNPFERARKETFWALRDISFDAARGEVIGIIGRNGAGKSTLLKVLSRITEPSAGQIDLYGRVGSLLEVGTGFHPELTGRENIFLNGTILGMSRRDVAGQFDAIVDFAGVEQFLDTPVKRYSSGMYVRLAFAVAAHLSSDILIVDEVLAVGDAEFQKKCLGKMQDVAVSGRTVLFVSHQMQAISALCGRALYLEHGRLAYEGGVSQAIRLYLDARETSPEDASPIRRSGSGELRFRDFSTDSATYLSTDDIAVTFDVVAMNRAQRSYFISLEIINRLGIPVLHLDSRLLGREFSCTPKRQVTYRIKSPRLAQGDYAINAYLCSPGGVIDSFERAAEFSIAPLLPYPASRNDCAANALVYPEFYITDEADDKRIGMPDEDRGGVEWAVS